MCRDNLKIVFAAIWLRLFRYFPRRAWSRTLCEQIHLGCQITANFPCECGAGKTLVRHARWWCCCCVIPHTCYRAICWKILPKLYVGEHPVSYRGIKPFQLNVSPFLFWREHNPCTTSQPFTEGVESARRVFLCPELLCTMDQSSAHQISKCLALRIKSRSPWSFNAFSKPTYTHNVSSNPDGVTRYRIFLAWNWITTM